MTDEQTTLERARQVIANGGWADYKLLAALCDELDVADRRLLAAEKVVEAAREVSGWGDSLVTGYHGFKDTRLHDVKGLREALFAYKEKRE